MKTSAATYSEARYVAAPEAARILGLSDRTMRHYCATQTVPARRVGSRWLVPTWWMRGEPDPNAR